MPTVSKKLATLLLTCLPRKKLLCIAYCSYPKYFLMSDVRNPLKMISGSLKNIERKLVSDHGVHLPLPPPPPPFLLVGMEGGGVEPPTKFSKRELDRISIFRGRCWIRPFPGGRGGIAVFA